MNEIECVEILRLASNSAVWSNCSFSELFHTLLFSKNPILKSCCFVGELSKVPLKDSRQANNVPISQYLGIGAG